MKYINKTGGVITFSIGEKELRCEFIIFPGEHAELPEGNSYIASIEAQKIIEKVPEGEQSNEASALDKKEDAQNSDGAVPNGTVSNNRVSRRKHKKH